MSVKVSFERTLVGGEQTFTLKNLDEMSGVDMRSEKELERLLDEIDGKGYGAYKRLKGSYELGKFQLFIEYVQGDPYASPSRFRIRAAQSEAKIPYRFFETKTRRIALEDFITRKFSDCSKRIAKGHRGSGKSGMIAVVDYGQAVLQRTSCEVNQESVDVIFVLGLPAKGRTPLSRIQAREMIFGEVPEIAERSMIFENLDEGQVKRHVETVEDSEFIRGKLKDEGLVAFISDGSILPRESGFEDSPMSRDEAVPFESPESLRVSFDTPNHGKIEGMGIPEGITLIVGGGFHGKSTFMNAIAKSVYNHIPGDGREFVVSNPNAAVIRAEDGRFVENVDITPFISNLPSGEDTSKFSTKNASGSTSQASNITEALEAGAELLLIDEDTSATNFMIRDERMQELVAKEDEPITPLIDKIRQLYDDKGVSTILVMGGSGDYFDIADFVIQMKNFNPIDVTQKSKKIAEKYEEKRRSEASKEFGDITHRAPDPSSINPRKKSGKVKIKARGMDKIQFGYEDVDLSRIHQIAEVPQVRSIGDILFYAARNVFDGETTVREGLNKIERILEEKGLQEFTPYNSGNYAVPRRHEVIAALNRLRTLRVIPQ